MKATLWPWRRSFINRIDQTNEDIKKLHTEFEETKAAMEALNDNNVSVSQKIQNNSVQLQNALKRFEVQFNESNSKLHSSNTDIWNEIKGLHLKAELNGKCIIDYREKFLLHEAEFNKY